MVNEERNRGRGGWAIAALLAGAVLAGCGVTPPYQVSPTVAAPTTSPSPSTTPSQLIMPDEPEPTFPAPAEPPEPEPTLPAEPAPTASASTPKPLAPQPDGKVDCRKVKCIAITFDDGPGPYTAKLLKHLERANVPATFFVLGQKVKASPKVARAIVAGGHEIAVHTWDHPILTKLTAEQVWREIATTIKVIKKTTGKTPKLLRPPYGETNVTVAIQAKRAKVAQILWSVDTLDWKTRSTKKTVKAALKQTKRGSILLLHDIHKTSVAAVPDIIDGLRRKGYVFVTVSQLLGKTKPGRLYSHG
jgi:peptidoglycan/xylan/chitin deacetylase (PgdA/CDA1 family)